MMMERRVLLEIASSCRGVFFPAIDQAKRDPAIDDNKKPIDEAAELGTTMVVLVCGAEPRQSLEDSRKQIQEGIASLLPYAANAGVRLAIEPLHPMYADTRSAINTLGQANDVAEALNSPWVGVAVDVYHLWWDPALEQEIKRCGQHGNLLAFHICDWNVPTTDMLNDRGLMGEGCIPVPTIRKWVEDAGFNGFNEVEIFSHKFWKEDQSEFLKKIIKAYRGKA
jgi:sugar phosphate isomerase/epimerase